MWLTATHAKIIIWWRVITTRIYRRSCCLSISAGNHKRSVDIHERFIHHIHGTQMRMGSREEKPGMILKVWSLLLTIHLNPSQHSFGGSRWAVGWVGAKLVVGPEGPWCGTSMFLGNPELGSKRGVPVLSVVQFLLWVRPPPLPSSWLEGSTLCSLRRSWVRYIGDIS